MNEKVKISNQVNYLCQYRVVFCPKYRKPVLVDDIQERLLKVVQEVCKGKKAELLNISCQTDSVDMTISVDPQFGVHRLVKAIKSTSSNVLRKEFPRLKSSMPSMWTNAYFVSTVGADSKEDAEQFIEQQKRRGQK